MDMGSTGKPTKQDHISTIHYEIKRRYVFLFIWYAGLPLKPLSMKYFSIYSLWFLVKGMQAPSCNEDRTTNVSVYRLKSSTILHPRSRPIWMAHLKSQLVWKFPRGIDQAKAEKLGLVSF